MFITGPVVLVLLAGTVTVGMLVTAGVAIALSHRLDLFRRRQAYEVECLVRSIQMLKQQNTLLTRRLNAVITASQGLAQEVDMLTRRSVRAVAEEETLPANPGSRIVH